jgi:hypothetical protein
LGGPFGGEVANGGASGWQADAVKVWHDFDVAARIDVF